MQEVDKAAIAKNPPMKRREYAVVKGPQCMVVAIEVVVEVKDAPEAGEQVAQALDTLRNIGAAEVVGQQFVLNSFQDACVVLASRSANFKTP